MDEDELQAKTNELVTLFYGQDNSVSDEEIQTLIRGLRNRRERFARDLAETIQLSRLSLEELTEELSREFRGTIIRHLDPGNPEGGSLYLEKLIWACQELHQKGYGARLPSLLYEPIIEGFRDEDPKVSILEAVRTMLDPMRTLVFLKPAGES